MFLLIFFPHFLLFEYRYFVLLLLFFHHLPAHPFLLHLLQMWIRRVSDLYVNFMQLHSPPVARLRLKVNIYRALISGCSERNINLPLKRPYRPPPQTAAACLWTRGRNVYLWCAAAAHLSTPDSEESFHQGLVECFRRHTADVHAVDKPPAVACYTMMTNKKKNIHAFNAIRLTFSLLGDFEMKFSVDWTPNTSVGQVWAQ